MGKGKKQEEDLKPRRLNLDDIDEVEKEEEEPTEDIYGKRASGMYLPVGKIVDKEEEYKNLEQFPPPLSEQLKQAKFEEEEEDEGGLFDLHVSEEEETGGPNKNNDPLPEYNNIRPWKPGQSGNPLGKPRGARNTLKDVGQRIAGSRAYGLLSAKQRNLANSMGFNADEITIIEALMLNLATSANPNKIALFLERTYGKVPNINLNAQLNENLITRFRSKLTDSELEEVANGADVLEILLSKLPDADDSAETGQIIDAGE